MAKPKKIPELTTDQMIDSLSENHAKFVIRMLMAGEKVYDGSVRQAIDYAKNHVEW